MVLVYSFINGRICVAFTVFVLLYKVYGWSYVAVQKINAIEENFALILMLYDQTQVPFLTLLRINQLNLF